MMIRTTGMITMMQWLSWNKWWWLQCSDDTIDDYESIYDDDDSDW